MEVRRCVTVQAKAKRRKADANTWSCLHSGKPAPSGEARYASGVADVLAIRWSRSLLALPRGICWVPRER